MYMYMYRNIYIYIHTYTCIYIYTHIFRPLARSGRFSAARHAADPVLSSYTGRYERISSADRQGASILSYWNTSWDKGRGHIFIQTPV